MITATTDEVSESTQTVPKFNIGDPVGKNGNVNFISGRCWVGKLNTWRYFIDYSQTNMCSNSKWQGGGSGGYYNESELTIPTGADRLQGGLWRKLREMTRLEHVQKSLAAEIGHLRFALETLAKNSTPC